MALLWKSCLRQTLDSIPPWVIACGVHLVSFAIVYWQDFFLNKIHLCASKGVHQSHVMLFEIIPPIFPCAVEVEPLLCCDGWVL